MIGKDLRELCLEFGTLSAHQRIDVLSGLLQMCLGPELRFIGSVVVDLCKKDYIYLREQENKANKPEELASLKQNPTDIKNLQQTMALNLALLHTDNTHCASIVFDILENNMKQAFSITTATEKESVDIILLVLTMAMRHPAFTFYQRNKLFDYYMCVKQQLESVLCKVDNETHQEMHTEPRCNQEAEHICNLDVVKAERKREYKIQVTWQGNKKTEVLKTYLDFKEFHSKLVKQFPEEADLPRQDRKLPFFSGNPGTNVTKEDEQTIAQYTKHLLQMPKSILDSELVVNFFRGENTTKSLNAKSTTPVNATNVSKEADTVIGYPPVQVVNSPNPADEPQLVQNLAPFPANCIVTQRHPPLVSPSHSPQPINLMSPGSCSNTPEEQEGTNQIKEANINQNCIEKAPPIKHSSMDENSSLALTPEKAAKVRADLALLKRDKLSNGLIDNYQQVPHVWNIQMMQSPFQAMPHPPVQVLQTHLPPASQTSTRDSSPSGSDYSSPLQSPSLRKKTVTAKETDSSSEEEKTHQNGSPHLRRLHKTMSGDGYCQEGYEVGGLAALTRGGYQSDPSPGYYPVINMAPRPLKAQPAHTSKAIPPNSIINMPGDSLSYGKRTQVASIPLGMAPSIPRTDTSTMTSSSNVTSVTTHMDNSGKSHIPYPYAIHPLSGHRTFVCSVTNSTSVTMSNSNNITSSHSVNGLKPQMTHSLSETAISNPHSQEQPLPPSMGQPQTIPTSAPNMQHLSSPAHSTCSSCGCTGHSGTSASYPYHFIPSQMFHGQQLFPWTTAPLTHSSNGLIHHPFIPSGYHYQPFQNLNGVAHPEYLLNNHHHSFVHNPGLPLAGPTGNAPGPIMNQGLQRSISVKERKEKPRVLSCYNCGSQDHVGHDCSDNSMQSILGQYHLNYESKE